MKTYKRLSILCIAVLLCALLPVLAGATSPGDPSEAVDPNAVYVSNSGNDDTGNGSQESPYATLAKAVGEAEDGATIYVMSDLTMTQSARFWNKDLTITSYGTDPVTVSRGEPFTPVSDPARGGYNGAMLEVGRSGEGGVSSLILSNIIFDDNGLRGGDASTEEDEVYFIQAASDGDGNTDFGNLTEENNNPISNLDIVQDAIVATYDGSATITLGDGAILKNYGGMSAVRISGGELIMEDGSSIVDDEDLPARTKGTAIQGAETGLYGPAGAVWVQSGSVEMQKGSLIENINGRVIYSDGAGSDVSIAGTIQNITGNSQMWQGNNGSVAHIRNGSSCTLADGCLITNDFSETSKVTGNMFSIIQENSQLLMENGAKIQNWTGAGNVFYVVGAQNQYKCTLKIDGEISGVNTGGNHIVQATQAIVSIKENAYIHHNKVNYGSIYIQGGNEVNIYGKINYNYSTDRGGAIAITNHGDSTVNMYDGAELVGNYSKETGGGLLVSDGTFTMYGGIISENVASLEGGGVFVREGGSFVMAGGTITDNITATVGGGIAFQAGSSCTILEGGTITDNVMKATVTSNDTEGTFATQGGDSNDISITSTGSSSMSTYCTVDSHFVLGNPDVYMQKYGFTLIDPQRGTKLGNAATACETAVKNKYSQQYLTDVKGSFWYQSEEDLVLRLSDLEYEKTKPLLVSIVETKADGTPADGAEPTLQAVSPDEDGVISLPLSGNENGYAVVFVQEKDASGIITVVPANLIAYMGGDGGYESVVDEEGNVVGEENTSLPRPIFKVTGPENVDLKTLIFENEESKNTWKLEPASEGSSYYRFVPVKGDTEVRVQYDGGDVPVTEDHFTPALEGDVFKEYTVTIYSGNTSGDKVEAGNGKDLYTVITGAGILTVRAVNNEQDEAVTEIQESVTTPTSGSAVAVEPKGGTTYTLNNTDVQLPDDAVPSLLFDDIIEDKGSTDRTDALKAKADDTIGSESENRQYEIKYLDLVDANNGNAWITSSNGIDIYWAYPAGTSSSTEFTLLHFKGLHRDGANSGYDVSDINSVDPEKVTIEKTANGIKFHVEPGSFSPFALVWEESAVTPPPVTPSEPADPDDTGVSDLLDTENHNQYLFGYPEGTFGPDQNMTRAEVAQMFYNLLVDKNVAITATFEDVPADAWYAKSVNTLASMGIISGVGENRFEPERSITRAEFTSMAMKFTKGALDGTNVFSDVHSGDWFYEAVVGSIQYGWIEGYEDGTFRPENWITRVEVTSIVNKMLGRFADREFVAGHADELNAFSDVTSTHWGYYHIVEATNSHTYTKPSTNVETWTELK